MGPTHGLARGVSKGPHQFSKLAYQIIFFFIFFIRTFSWKLIRKMVLESRLNKKNGVLLWKLPVAGQGLIFNSLGAVRIGDCFGCRNAKVRFASCLCIYFLTWQ